MVRFVERRVWVGQLLNNNNNTNMTDTRVYMELGTELLLTNLHIYSWAASGPLAGEKQHVERYGKKQFHIPRAAYFFLFTIISHQKTYIHSY